MAHAETPFLTAEWRDLLMLNFLVEPACLREFVPAGTELDSFAGKTYASLIGFRFCKTKLGGRCPIPFHSEFEEINLRFYVRCESAGELRRGVVFIAEIVPKLAVAKTARWLYGENYVRRRMRHRVKTDGLGNSVEYAWQGVAGECALYGETKGEPSLASEGSLEQFITEHYWGYSRQKDGAPLEYQVEHPPWRVWNASSPVFTGDPSDLYGEELAQALRRPPDSAFIAEGSAVSVYSGRHIP